MPVGAEHRDGSKQAIGGGIDDGERRPRAISPHRPGGLDERVGVGGGEWLGDRHPPSDLRVLADREQLGCIRGTPWSKDQLVDGQDRSRFAVHLTILSVQPPTTTGRAEGQPPRRSASQRILTTSWKNAPPSWSLNGYSTISLGPP